MDKYNKYSKINDLLKNKKEIDNSYSKDKNLSKLKLRSKRVIEYLNMLNKYNIKESIPISYILNSTKKSFSNILQNLMLKIGLSVLG